jgi:hypothetical protein
VDLSDMDSEQSNSFTVPRSGDLAFFENPGRPCELVFSSRVPLDDIADIPFPRQCYTGIQSIIGRVKPGKDFSGLA